MKSGIYSITCNEHLYIGSAVDIDSRWYRHIYYLGKQTHCNKLLQNLFNKYGKEGLIFSIVELCEKERLIEREQYYIDILNPDINVCRKAGSTLGIKMSEETKKKLSEKFKGMQRSKGRKQKPETIEKLRQKAKERGLSQNFIEGNRIYREKHLKQSRETVRKRSLAKMKLNESQIKQILVLMEEGKSQKQIAKIFNVGHSTIGNISIRKGIYKEIIDRLNNTDQTGQYSMFTI